MTRCGRGPSGWSGQRFAQASTRPAARLADLTAYTRGVVAVAVIDAVLIGLGLLVLGVPLVLPLAVLTFFGAFVPIIGATLAGAAAVLVALVSDGVGTALAVLAVVLVVQQVEGNLLQPLIMRRAVHLHPVAIVLAVSAGALLAGVPGAIIATPLLAVGYRVTAFARDGLPAQPGITPDRRSASESQVSGRKEPVNRAGPCCEYRES